ncbi:putative periplasmic protein [Halobacteriovorax marinus SJ]|uniref:Periplasmic protein n=1 Tax=Halobacteriovorax marinus (strain ATCC BAA-682 / DSM 15412 / SJ) TaxID=862908 RepID=E1WYC5_HALMS|nr:M23 family metallopeptidase [Halobacteriovorax marinus]CBW25973.1 putative periplasmic protein [Halobacteriovorax marinus SJ]
MKKLIYILVFIITSCSTSQKVTQLSEQEKELESIKFPKPLHTTIENGAVKKAQFIYPFQRIKASLFCGGHEIALGTPKDGLATVYISSSRHKTEGNIWCEYRFNLGKVEKKIPVAKYSIVNANYPLRKLTVPKKYAKLSDEAIERWKRESAHMEKVYAEVITDHALFDSPFKKPLNSKITAKYGSKRLFNDMKHSWHSGIDFRARIGTKIPSANRGKVILARDHFFTGKTVIIDHGMGILTMYCHLSKFKVVEGDIIPKGGIIALSGNTGRSSGPHLHWGVRVNGHWVNGFTLLNEGI